MKFKIIVDSSSGLTCSQAEEYGWTLLPLQAEINGKTYEIGKNLTIHDFAKIWNENPKKCDVKTAACIPATIMNMVEECSKDYDKILIYTISKELSSQNSMLKTMFADNDKVYVIDSTKLSYLIVKDLLLFEEAMKNGQSFEEACKIFAEEGPRLLLIPEFNDALVKGGRLTKPAAAIARLFKIVPIIQFGHGALTKFGIGRVFRKTLVKQLIDMKNVYPKPIDEDTYLILPNAAQPKMQEIAKELKDSIDFKDAYAIDLSPDISIHTGIGAVCFTITNIPKSIKEKFFKFTTKY